MKKTNYLFVFFFMLGLLFYPSLEAKASSKRTLTMEGQEGIYYTRNGGTLTYASNIFSFYSLDGNVSYCVEPGVEILEYTYTEEEGLENLSFSKDVKEWIQLIGYYGYEYPGHQTVRYRMATQALIWEAVSKGTVEFYTKRYGYGDLIDIHFEREEIKRLVATHHEKPSFHNLEVEGYLNSEIVLEDKNAILNNFEVLETDSNSVFIVGNELHIIPKKIGKSEILLKKRRYDNETTLLFVPNNGKGQKIAKLRAEEEVVSKISLDTLVPKVTIQKVDSDTKTNISQGMSSLEGAVYGIYDQKNQLLTTIQTDLLGKAESTYLKGLGKYKLKEIQASLGYELDPTIYEFEITKENLYPHIQVLENVIKRKVTLFKTLEGSGNTLLKGEGKITFSIYLKDKNQFYQDITTDENGYATINLPYGTYLFKQKNTTLGYEKVEDFEVVIDENSDLSISKLLVDKRVKTKLKVMKIDKETKEPILKEGILFKIKDQKTNLYVCQRVSYPTPEEICVFKTDKKGEFTTPDFLFGEFLLEEVENQTIDGYLWNPKPISFSTLKDVYEKDEFGENRIVLSFSNERVKGKIEINKKGEELKIENGKYFYQEIPLPYVKFNLLANEDIYLGNQLCYKKGDLVKTVTTNALGKASIDNLLLGSYSLVEIESSKNHVLDPTPYVFELKYKDQYTKEVIEIIDLKNELPKGRVEFFKLDAKTNLPLSDTLIEIYKKDSLKETLIYKGYTNTEGKIILANLPVGTYFLQEKESLEGYQLNKEIISFSLHNKETKKIEMVNQPIEKVEVPNTLMEDSSTRRGIGFLLIGMGIFFILFKGKRLKS